MCARACARAKMCSTGTGGAPTLNYVVGKCDGGKWDGTFLKLLSSLVLLLLLLLLLIFMTNDGVYSFTCRPTLK